MCAPSPAVTLDSDVSACRFHYILVGIKSINSIQSSTLHLHNKGTRILSENPNQFEQANKTEADI